MVGKWTGAATALITAFVAVIGLAATNAQAAAAQVAPEHGGSALVMVDAPRDGEVTTLGTSCGGVLNPCGIAYNRTGSTLQLSRDASSHLYCGAVGPYRDLPSGQNSNAYGSPRWPDVDCVRSNTRWIVTNGRVYPPGEWIRIWTSKWFYGA
jgi:hypothetical protein